MIKQLAHICIYTADLDATSRFYFEGLGLERGYEFIKDGALFGYYIKLGNDTFIEVFKGEPGGAGNINHVAIQVDDMDGETMAWTIHELLSKGILEKQIGIV